MGVGMPRGMVRGLVPPPPPPRGGPGGGVWDAHTYQPFRAGRGGPRGFPFHTPRGGRGAPRGGGRYHGANRQRRPTRRRPEDTDDPLAEFSAELLPKHAREKEEKRKREAERRKREEEQEAQEAKTDDGVSTKTGPMASGREPPEEKEREQESEEMNNMVGPALPRVGQVGPVPAPAPAPPPPPAPTPASAPARPVRLGDEGSRGEHEGPKGEDTRSYYVVGDILSCKSQTSWVSRQLGFILTTRECCTNLRFDSTRASPRTRRHEGSPDCWRRGQRQRKR